MVNGRWRGLSPGHLIGRPGLAEGQSALTGRGAGDAPTCRQVDAVHGGLGWLDRAAPDGLASVGATLLNYGDPPVVSEGQASSASRLSRKALCPSHHTTTISPPPSLSSICTVERKGMPLFTYCHKLSEDIGS